MFLAEEGLEAPSDSNASAASDARLLAGLDDAACGLAQTAANGLIQRVNLAFCSWLGYSRDELLGKRKLQDLLTAGSRIFYQTHALPLLLMQGSVSEVRLEAVRRDGTVLPMMLNALRHEKQGVVVHEVAVFVAQDRDRYEQELIHSRQQLQALVEQAHQLQAQAKDRALFAEQMVGIVSHDLRNPMMVILMSAEILGKRGMTPEQSGVVGRILKAADRANRLITDLLDLTQARLGSGLAVSTVPIDLHATVAEAVAELGQAFPNRVLSHVHQGLGRCTADADRLTQLVGNLVANAIAYGAPDTPVVVTSAITQDTFSISVENQGNPIPGKMMEGLFKLMVRGSGDANHARSIGLGLFIVSEIAKAHGGTAKVASTLEGYTIFTTVFPCNPPLAGGEPG
ncbi:MAG: HAMP domain-containing sensor histidine kinase [Polaromonas sp.]